MGKHTIRSIQNCGSHTDTNHCGKNNTRKDQFHFERGGGAKGRGQRIDLGSVT